MKSSVFAAWMALAASVMTIPAAIAGEPFSGFYISGGLGQKSTNVEEGVSGGGNSASIKLGDTAFFGQLAGGYGFAFDGGLRLAIGGFYDIGDGKAGGGTATIGGLTATYALKETRHYGVSIEPGYAIAKDSVAYIKLMYNWIKGEETLSGATSAYASKTFNAFGYGVGLKHAIGSNAFLFAEWQQTQYDTASFTSGNSTVTFKPNASLGLAGIGIQF